MKITTFPKILVLSLVLPFLSAPALAQATTASAVVAVLCRPAQSRPSDILQVAVQRGNVHSMPVEMTLNYHGEVRSFKFTVEKSASSDLRYEQYQSQGFSLSVDAMTGRANLKANVQGEIFSASNLKCQFNEIGRHPGVTASN
jgi:hypothetical protein